MQLSELLGAISNSPSKMQNATERPARAQTFMKVFLSLTFTSQKIRSFNVHLLHF